MKTKMRRKYYCDFCKKGGGSKFHMAKHEKGCTKNPNRDCGMCAISEGHGFTLPELIALLPVQFKEGQFTNTDLAREAITAAIPELIKAANGCPACILAAIRQSGIPVYMVTETEFDFKKSREEFMSKVNDLRMEGISMSTL